MQEGKRKHSRHTPPLFNAQVLKWQTIFHVFLILVGQSNTITPKVDKKANLYNCHDTWQVDIGRGKELGSKLPDTLWFNSVTTKKA